MDYVFDSNGSNVDYLVADNYLQWKDIRYACENRTLPGGTWVKITFNIKKLQNTNTKMWKEWLPNCNNYSLCKK